MSETDTLQFDHAEFQQGAAPMTCAVCNERIFRSYFQINDAVACTTCRYRLEQTGVETSGVGRFLRAAGAGVAAAVGGAVLYYAISALTGYEFSLIAIVVGFAVGRAVHWGSHGRGGWRYQTLAMVLTYVAIASTYIPPIIRAIRERPAEAAATQTTGAPSADAVSAPEPAAAADAPAETPPVTPADKGKDVKPSLGGFLLAIALLLAFACAAPFLAGAQNVIGLVIIGIGVYEAWKLNKHVPIVISGPHAIAPSPAAPAATAAPAVS
jgi:hypothetical protein